MKKYGAVRLGGAFFLVMALFSMTMVSCQEKDEDRVKPKTITDVILENEQFSILRDVVLYTGMKDALRTTELTFFAPSNAAFLRANILGSSAITALPKDSAMLFLKSHLVGANALEFKQLAAGKLKSLAGREIFITKIDSTVSVNAAKIIIHDVNADNGVIHVIDNVVVPLR
ncbi:fasciclin domain-containing protein [Dyadobacter sandarakinus]|uniref:Fasciclin domain-containing protein n=1 Tax=Dyadobacter sandarakinus TaxID=2747268 RepID=A0ABX7I9R7_9BACT|nr:fasciclin domain-containing protein [Dyadobacter sandarakinus]QRR02272.1 fasciclin domain-containing protein [Dyadobacter sandarakinus]